MTGRVTRYLGRHHWGILATFIALGGTSYAVSSAAQSNVHGCVDRMTGAVRIATRCQRGERALTWAKSGPRGPVGPVGPSDAYFSEPAHRFPLENPDAVVTVPAGNYVATGGCGIGFGGPGQVSSPVEFAGVRSTLSAKPGPILLEFSSTTSVADSGSPPSTTANAGSANLTTDGAFALPHGGAIIEHCSSNDATLVSSFRLIFGSYLTVIRVGTLNGLRLP